MKPFAATGTIAKFVVVPDRASKKDFSHAYSARTKDADCVVHVTAYQDRGKHSTIRGVLTTR